MSPSHRSSADSQSRIDKPPVHPRGGGKQRTSAQTTPSPQRDGHPLASQVDHDHDTATRQARVRYLTSPALANSSSPDLELSAESGSQPMLLLRRTTLWPKSHSAHGFLCCSHRPPTTTTYVSQDAHARDDTSHAPRTTRPGMRERFAIDETLTHLVS